jgi:hypothetical protein
MRTFSSAIQTVLLQDKIDYFVLIKVDLGSTQFFLTSLPYNVTFAGDLYLSNDIIDSFAGPRYSSVVDRELYSIVLNDVDNTLLNEFLSSQYTGGLVTVYFSFLDANKQPLLGINDVIVGYEGVIDGVGIANDWETKKAKIECASPMASLDLVKTFIISPDGMDQVSATDTAFDTVLVDTSIESNWGKF